MTQPPPSLYYTLAFGFLGASFLFISISGRWITEEGSLVVNLEFGKLILVGQSSLQPVSLHSTNLQFAEGFSLYRFVAPFFHDSSSAMLFVTTVVTLVGIPTYHIFLTVGHVPEDMHGVAGVLYTRCCDVWVLLCYLSQALADVVVKMGLHFSCNTPIGK
jgi:hypothetical protein